jgi:hypothetical protein
VWFVFRDIIPDSKVIQQNETKMTSLKIMKLETPKAGAEQGLLLCKPVSVLANWPLSPYKSSKLRNFLFRTHETFQFLPFYC